MKSFALKGNIIYTPDARRMLCAPNSYLVCQDGRVAGVFSSLPEKYSGIHRIDHGDRLIIPGLVDLHLHAPQFSFRGLGMDLELLDWLNTNTFPEESKFADLEYAQKAYRIFTAALAASATTRACIFATVHPRATLLLMELLEQTGIRAMVGKVNMDRNCPDYLREQDATHSLADTREWLAVCREQYKNITPILTPRFIPTCSDRLMEGLGELQRETGLAVQSHLSENRSEIAWVNELCPQANCYGAAYDQFGLFGGSCPTVMAHCVYPSAQELALLKQRGVFVAHCPQSNTNLSSGIAPVRTFLMQGIPVGLGTDVAGGHSLSMLRTMADAVQVSKLRWRLVDSELAPLSITEAFYLGTKGGGAFFGKVGSFEEGYEFDAVVLDDRALPYPQTLTPTQRLERMVYLSDDRHIIEKYAAGVQVKTQGAV